MANERVIVKYSDLIDLLGNRYGDIILESLRQQEIVIIDDDGNEIGRIVLGDD